MATAIAPIVIHTLLSCGRVSALRLVGCGCDSQLGHTKDYKNSPHYLPAWHSFSGLDFGKLDHQMNPGPVLLLPTAPWEDAKDKFPILQDWDFNF